MNIFYENTKDDGQALDLYTVKTPTAPLLVYIHGGAWVSGDKADYAAWAKYFNGQGFHVAVVNYRLSLSPAIRHPSHVDDVSAALNWLCDDARKPLGLEPKKIFPIGHSAGAHILGMIATRVTNPKIAGFVGLSGIYDLPTLARVWPGYPDWFMKRAFGADVKRWGAYSPQEQKIVSGAPWLILHSENDELVDLGQSVAFAKHLGDEKRNATLVKLKGPSHFGVIDALTQNTNPAAKALNSFIEKN